MLSGANVPVPTSDPSSAETRPAVVYVSGLNRYRVVWQDDREYATMGWDIRGQWVAADGAAAGTLDAPIFRYPGNQQHPAIAYSPAYDTALVVWQDERNGVSTDVYGRFGALDSAPPLARFTRDPVYGQVGEVFTLNAWPSIDDTTPKGALEVRWDLDSNGTWDVPLGSQKYLTPTIMTAGFHTVTLQVWDSALLTDSLTLRVFAYTPSVALQPAAPLAAPPTATLSVSPTMGVAGTTFSFDGTGSSGTGALLARWDWENDGLFDTSYGATLTATHAYTTAGDVSVRLEVRDTASGLSHADLQNIIVQAGEPISLALAPADATIVAHEGLPFRVSAWDSYSNRMTNPGVTWTVSLSEAGTIDARGVFTASGEAATYPDAVKVATGVLSDTASVTVFWPYSILLPVTLKAYQGDSTDEHPWPLRSALG